MTCPICDAPATLDVEELISRITNPDLLVTLACDFACRVINLLPDPRKARKWLAEARAWKDNSSRLREIKDGIDREQSWLPQEEVIRAAIGAAMRASARETETTWLTGWVVGASRPALELADDKTSELDWQLFHVKETACTCPVLLEPLCDYPRSRRSLLASPDRSIGRLSPGAI